MRIAKLLTAVIAESPNYAIIMQLCKGQGYMFKLRTQLRVLTVFINFQSCNKN